MGNHFSIKSINLFIKEKNIGFWPLLFKNPFFLALAIIFVIGKVTTNLVLGASWTNALRSGFMGVIAYILGCYLIHLISTFSLDGENQKYDAKFPNYFYWIIGWFIFSQIILTLHIMNSYNIINFQTPIWSQISKGWSNLVGNWVENSPYIEGTGLIGWPNLILYVLVPVILLWKSKLSFPKVFGLKTAKAAMPFVGIYIIGFVFIKGVSITNLLTLLFVLIWPALGEEFFYRGIIQRLLTNVTNNPITSIVLMSLLFTASHIPIYFLGYYSSPVIALSSLLPLLFTSFLWGYGYYRTGVLWPWILIHALSNLVGF